MKAFVIIVVFLIVTGLGVKAQIIDGYVKSKARTAQNRAVYDADKEVDSQINKGVDNQFNKLKSKVLSKDEKPAEGEAAKTETSGEAAPESNSKSSSRSSDDAMSKAIMGKMGINMTRPENMKDTYSYTGNIVMDVENWNDEGESEGVVDYTTNYSDKENGFAMVFKDKEKGKSIMIFDYDNLLMIILGDDGSEKNGFATPLGAYQSQPETATPAETEASKAEVENYYSSFKKTGKTKTIAGYKCEEYSFEDEEDKVSYWMTTELPAELWSKMYTSNLFTSLSTGRANGFVMESDSQSKDSKQRSHMIVKEVNPKKPASISTVGYNVMTMNVAPAAEPEKSEKERKGDK